MKERLTSLLGASVLGCSLALSEPAPAAIAVHGGWRVPAIITADRTGEISVSSRPVRLAAAMKRLPRLMAPTRARTQRPRPPVTLPPRTRIPPSRLRKPPAQDSQRHISPSEALQLAMRAAPGSMGLGVELLPGPRPVYSVKLKAGNRVMRVLVDAVTGRIVGR